MTKWLLFSRGLYFDAPSVTNVSPNMKNMCERIYRGGGRYIFPQVCMCNACTTMKEGLGGFISRQKS